MVGNRTANVITNLIETVYKSGDFVLAINDFFLIFDYFFNLLLLRVVCPFVKLSIGSCSDFGLEHQKLRGYH